MWPISKRNWRNTTSEYSMLPLADYIIIALPATIIPKIIPCIKPLVKHEQILINISTDTEETTLNNFGITADCPRLK